MIGHTYLTKQVTRIVKCTFHDRILYQPIQIHPSNQGFSVHREDVVVLFSKYTGKNEQKWLKYS